MEHDFTIGPVKDVRAIADQTELMAHEVRRLMKAFKEIVNDLEVVYQTVAAPVFEWLMAPPGPPATLRTKSRC